MASESDESVIAAERCAGPVTEVIHLKGLEFWLHEASTLEIGSLTVRDKVSGGETRSLDTGTNGEGSRVPWRCSSILAIVLDAPQTATAGAPQPELGASKPTPPADPMRPDRQIRAFEHGGCGLEILADDAWVLGGDSQQCQSRTLWGGLWHCSQFRRV